MRLLNPDTDSHTTKTGKEGFTLKANQKEENLNGCAAPTKTESEGIDTDIEALETYICDNFQPERGLEVAEKVQKNCTL